MHYCPHLAQKTWLVTPPLQKFLQNNFPFSQNIHKSNTFLHRPGNSPRKQNPYLDHLSNRCCNVPFRSTSASNRCIATPPAHLFPTLHISPPPPPPSLYKTYHPSLKSHRSVQPSLHSSTSTRTPVHHITNPCFPASSSPSPSPASPQPTLSPPPPPLPLSNSSLTPNTTLPLTPNASPVPSTLVTTSMNYSTSNVTNALPSATPL